MGCFGVKNQYRYIAIRTIANKLGRENSRALPSSLLSLAVIRCLFLAVSERKQLRKYEVTNTFIDPGNMPLSLSDETMKHLQRFLILLYDRKSQSTQVDHSRKLLFAKGRQIDRIPPTEAALKEHVNRAVYQAGYCWGQTLVVNQELPSPGEWDWKKSTILLCHFQKQPKCVKSL